MGGNVEAKPAQPKRRPNPLANALKKGADANREGNANNDLSDSTESKVAKSISVDLIDPSPWQPRKIFNTKKLEELAELIDAQGLLQPIEVRAINNRYQLVSGERRLRAHKLLQKRYIQAFVIVITDEEASARALVENLGRENLVDYEVYLSIKKHHEQFGAQHDYALWGMSKSSYFRILAFDTFPPAVNDILIDHPDLVSAYAADEVKKMVNAEVEKGGSKEKFEAALRSLIQKAVAGAGKLTNLANQVYALVNPHSPSRNKTTLEVAGKKAGEITTNANHTQLKLSHENFTEEKLAQVKEFIAAVADDKAPMPVVPAGAQPVKPRSAAKKGAVETETKKLKKSIRQIDPQRSVVSVSVEIDGEKLNGLLLVNKVVDQLPGKCVVEVSRPNAPATELIVDTSTIAILTIAEFAPID